MTVYYSADFYITHYSRLYIFEFTIQIIYLTINYTFLKNINLLKVLKY